MLSSTDFAAPPKYKEEYEEMRQKYENEKDFLDDFSSKRMMQEEIYERRYRYVWFLSSMNAEKADFDVRSVYQFHYAYHRKRKLYDEKMDFLDLEKCAYEDLDYPQIDLDQKYFEYERSYACSFMPKVNNVEKNKEIYLKIKSVENDAEKWVAALMESNDHEFVFHNVERRLGWNLNDKSLWLLYIDYLKTHDIQKLLQTYSKYIRFFLEDVDMIDEYREAVNKHGPVLVPWKNTEDFETYDEHFFEKEKECQSYQRTLPVECPPTLPRFNVENMIRQAFPFHDNLMFYIRKNASAEVLHKLYKTCKFFHARFPKTLCYRVEVDDSDAPVTIKNLCLKVSNDWLANTNVINLFIGNAFWCDSGDPLALSKIIPKIYQCSAKFINLYGQQFSLNDLKLLIDHGNVLSLCLDSPENSDGSYLFLEDILQLTPCIKEIKFDNRIQCTSETAKKLCEMNFKNKINHIRLYNLTNGLLDPNDFAKFVMKNCLPDTTVLIKFKFDGKEAFVSNFKAALGFYLLPYNFRVL